MKHVNNPEDYCLMAIDIEHFKLFNDWYGQEAGDRLLAMIGELLNKTQSEEGGLAGYMGGTISSYFFLIRPLSCESSRRR